ncbi:hypothetical protein BV898_12243 [Hypsibius exemplaris]|uniref:Uncharacterized protein n=1 Tax=Hypsibius exemplaris TaxID=2072580 RepID=A0A1W0WE54_HYPEX|nr:hypothetical protein BV898_12243 [Hypsibius exemplaris]
MRHYCRYAHCFDDLQTADELRNWTVTLVDAQSDEFFQSTERFSTKVTATKVTPERATVLRDLTQTVVLILDERAVRRFTTK